MNKILLLFILFSFSVFSSEIPEEVYQFEHLRIVKNPTSTLRGPISNDFIPEKATLFQSIELQNPTGISPETALFLRSEKTPEELMKFYEAVFLGRDWRILQKDNKGNKFVLLGENLNKKVMTILILDEKEYRVIKIFYRRPGF